MKANELMIGDWVGRVFDDKRIDYRQVDWIRTGEIGMRYQKVWAIGCIEPIQLTPEILEKNGFEMFKYDGWVHYYRIFGNGAIAFVLHSTIGGEMLSQEVDIFSTSTNTNRGIDVNYVHELQHALRLCGLNELADNFKL